MGLTITSSKLTGTPSASGWAQVHEFTPEETEKLKRRGRFFAIVSVSKAKEESDEIFAGRELVTRIHEEYFGNLESTAFNALKAALEKVLEEFKASWESVETGAVSYVEGVLYSAAGGGAQVSIFRNGMLAKILVSQKDSVVSASGYPHAGDKLVIASAKFFELFSSDEIKAALESDDITYAAEAFAPAVHGNADAGSLAAVVLGFSEEESLIRTDTDVEISPARQSIWDKIRKYVSSRLPSGRIYLRRERGLVSEELPGGKKVTVSVAVVLILLLIISIGFGISQKRIRDKKAVYATRLTEAQHKLDEAVDLFGLNPERARELFNESDQIAIQLTKEGVKDTGLLGLTTKIKTNREKILGEYGQDAEFYLDLSLLSNGFRGDDMASSGEKMFILDRSGKKIVAIAIATKKSEVVGGPDDVEDGLSIASYEDRTFVLGTAGIYEIEEGRKKVIEKAWEGEVAPYVYAGNFYILDKAGSTIWRYPGSGGGFATGTKWLGQGVSPDFSGAISMTIDGAIYVLYPSGKILKFSLGSPQAFNIAGVYPELSRANAIYTNEELKSIYILEKDSGRVVVLDKDGKYKAQYASDRIKEAVDLAVSEKEKKIILLTGSKLYSVEIKHL